MPAAEAVRMLLKIAAFVAPLGFDTLAIAIALGLRGLNPLRPAIVFAVFEGCMPLAGVVLGAFLSASFRSVAEYAGGVVLIGVGIHALREAGEAVEEAERLAFTTVRAMLLAGLAVSIDEIAVGFPLATEHLPIAWVLLVIALQAFVVGYAGVTFGRKLGEGSARRAGLLGGLAFIALGLWLIVSHAR